MKNIHVLPTEKPSKLRVHECGRLFLSINFIYGINDENKKHIYITSDEEIEKDYVIAYGVVIKVMMFDKETLYFVNGTKAKREQCKKIILTTDQDLIKDGVQAIDDNFLEWFVKNPSCERVDIKKLLYKVGSNYQGNRFDGYKIIIPKQEPKQTDEKGSPLTYWGGLEESKQELEKEMFDLEQELDIPSNLRWHNSKPKQETLEEVAEKFAKKFGSEIDSTRYYAFINGAKWQQEQDKKTYSEEEVLDILLTMSVVNPTNITEWFEKFKRLNCKHKNIKREDGLDECLDCGVTNY